MTGPHRSANGAVTKAIPRLAITQSELFQRWPADDTERLVDMADVIQLAEGDVLHRPGDVVEYLYLVAVGSLGVSMQTSSGRPFMIRMRFAGEFHGLGPLISNTPYLYTASARKEAHLVRLPGASLLDMLVRSGPLAIAMFAGLHKRHRRTISLYADAATHSLRPRLASLLESFLVDAPRQPASAVQLSQDEIANLLGSRRQVINRELRALESLGVLRLDYGRITITDREVLNALAANSLTSVD